MHSWIKGGLGAAALTLLTLAGLGAALSAMDAPLPIPTDLPNPGAVLPVAHPPQGLGFSVLHTGESRGAPEALIVGGGSWWRYRRPVQVAVLVRHPRANFLFDAGLGRQVDQQFAANTFMDRQFFAYRHVRPAADQLAKANWGAERIRMIVPSHLHWDHASALPDFPDAQVWISPAERSHAEQGQAPAFLRSQFGGVRHWRTLSFSHGPYLGFERSQDVFGDGAVVLVPLAGHTAGQVGMFLTLSSGRRYFFTGDTTWTLEGLQKPADRSWALRQMVHVDHDVRLNQRAIVQVHQLMQRFPQLIVVPAHDERLLARLPHFPQFQE